VGEKKMAPTVSCSACRDGDREAWDITMAFQPIVDTEKGTVFAHEALVRGRDGAGAAEVLGRVDAANRYAFDQACRVRALECAAVAGLPALLSINFLPNAVYNPEHCLRATLEAAQRHAWPLSRIIFEVTEHEEIADHRHLVSILEAYRRRGLLTAIDDFGAGFAGLNLLADFQPDLLKLDMGLVRGIDGDRTRQRIVGHVSRLCDELGVRVIAEGIESEGEYAALRDLGIVLQQGFLFARPLVGAVPAVSLPGARP
jgi:EAL domain-containing protein (putative c-di-GMP-specific phosphodiesterase class I)